MERSKRLEAEAELTRLNSKSDAIFSESETKEFSFLSEKLSYTFSVDLSYESSAVSPSPPRANTLQLVYRAIEKNSTRSSVNQESLRQLLRDDFSLDHPHQQIGKVSPESDDEIDSLLSKLKVYGLCRSNSYQQTSRLSVQEKNGDRKIIPELQSIFYLEFTEKAFRFSYWLSINGHVENLPLFTKQLRP